MWQVLVLLVVLGAATGFGLWWRARNGRLAVPHAGHAATPAGPGQDQSAATPAGHAATPAGRGHVQLRNPARLGFDPADARLTLVQFSTAFCQPCRTTRVLLGDLAARMPGVRHVEVDAESHLDVVRELDIRRTPTVLLVDSAGCVVNRVSGQPRRSDLVRAVAAHVGAPPVSETDLPDTGKL